MAILSLKGHRARRALSEGTAAINDGTTVDSGLSSITGFAIGVLAAGPPEIHVQVLSIATPAAVEFQEMNSVGTALTTLVTVGYIFTGHARRQ